ncbi:hypothetical protein F8M41_012069 [Gigaspora margarita]|uniref:Uncharacterized protein n=1 Tax=Gigaspora margarita TaxID=4874 RepID=A0A8H3WYF0_GIGMA|nr:hypothetical protein F8M41_012069 [Gigaspora margarita]
MSTFISYSYLSKAILDCKLPSEETLNLLSQNQQIENLNDIPNIQPPKRDKTKPSKLKLSELCPWLPKDYFSKIKADFTPHLEANNIKKSVTWSQLGYSARESWILDVCNKHILQIGSNKWIVEECLKQKLVDRADNFRRSNKKANLKVANSNIQITSEDELEPLQQTNKHIEEHSGVNKENIFESNIELDEYYQEDQENAIINEYDNEDHFTTSNSSSFGAPTSSNDLATSTYHEISDSTSDTALDSTFSDEEMSRNIPSQSYNDMLKSNTPIMKTTDRISNRTQQKCYVDSKNSLNRQVQKKNTLLSSPLDNENRKIQKTNINSKFGNKTRLSNVKF